MSRLETAKSASGGALAWVRAHRELLTVSSAGLLIALAWTIRWLGPDRPPHHGQGGWPLEPFAVLMVGAALIAGWPVAREAWGRATARQFSIALLVTIAALGAVWIGEYWEAAAVTWLYVLGGYLESLTLSRTRAALRSLVDMAPRTARVLRAGQLLTIAADEVQPGETVVVLPGDRVPVDGKVLSGQGILDTAALTGEPLPVEAGPGQTVLGGSVSRGGQLEIQAERVGADTTFSRLIYLVAEAQEQRPKVQRLLDAFARWYTPLVIASAGLLLAFTGNVRLGLTFLVIACPGALVVASPVAVVAGLGHAARRGIVIKGGERLERIARVDTVAFDKTGTLTQGRPSVQSVTVIGQGIDEREVLALAAAAEQRSEHHLATAILAHAGDLGVTPVPAADWRLEPGRGALAEATGGRGTILVGNRRLLEAHGVPLDAAAEAVSAEREAKGETIALVAAGGSLAGVIGITDPLRGDAAAMVSGLRQAGIRHLVMLTGDHEAAAQRVAATLGLDEVRAGLLPEDKVAAIRRLQAAGRIVAMVGDGINDAPALATADVSVAMGISGTQAAIETADVTLMTDRLTQVPYAIGLGRRIMRVVRQNVVFAVAVVVALMAGVVTDRVHLAGGMLVHEASVLLVIVNGMRLLRGAPGSGHAHAPAPSPLPIAPATPASGGRS